MDRVIKPAFADVLNKDMVAEIDTQLQKMYFSDAKEKLLDATKSLKGMSLNPDCFLVKLGKQRLSFVNCSHCGSTVISRIEGGSKILRITHYNLCAQFDPAEYCPVDPLDPKEFKEHVSKIFSECD